MNFKKATTHHFLVGNRECNTQRDSIEQLYIALGINQKSWKSKLRKSRNACIEMTCTPESIRLQSGNLLT